MKMNIELSGNSFIKHCVKCDVMNLELYMDWRERAKNKRKSITISALDISELGMRC